MLQIEMDGAWLGDSSGRKVGHDVLLLRDWSVVEVREYDAGSEAWRAATADSPLKDLAQAEFDEGYVALHGFSAKSGSWVEWRIQGGTTVYRVAD